MKGRKKNLLALVLSVSMLVSSLTPSLGAKAEETASGDTVEVSLRLGEEIVYNGKIENDFTSDIVTAQSRAYYYKEVTADEIVSGGQYLITSAKRDAIVTTTVVTRPDLNGYTGLSFDTDQVTFVDKDYSSYLWTFTEAENSTDESTYYQISHTYPVDPGVEETQTQEDTTPIEKYISLNSGGNLTLVEKTEESTVPTYQLISKNDGYVIESSNSDLKLNNLGGNDKNLLVSAWNDENSYWHLYQFMGENVTVITAQSEGQVDVQIGTTMYRITVIEGEDTYREVVWLKEGDLQTLEVKGTYDANTTVASGYDTAVVKAECAADPENEKVSVTLTGVGAGHTIVDVGATRYYVYVLKNWQDTEEKTESITVMIGETKKLSEEGLDAAKIVKGEGFDTYLEDYTCVSGSSDLIAVRGTETIDHQGISKYYAGDALELRECLYTFTKGSGDNEYIISRQQKDGTIYLNHHTAGTGKANTTSADSIFVEPDTSDPSVFYLNDNDGSNRYLYFHHKDDKINQLDAGNSYNSDKGYQFSLFRPATSAELENKAESALPGYVKVNTIESGMEYLIVASYEVDEVTYYYAIYPSTGSGTYDQTVLIMPEQKTDRAFSEVSFTGKTTGTTSLNIGNVTYNITVQEAQAAYTHWVYLEAGETQVCDKEGTYNANTQLSTDYDQSIVQASISNADEKTTVTFLGLAQGFTVVDAGSNRYYVYVFENAAEEEAREEEITLYAGQRTRLYASAGAVEKSDGFENYLSGSLESGNRDLLAVYGDQVIEYGSIKNYYVGDFMNLSRCLYTFEISGEKYVVTASDAQGNTVYLNHDDAGVGKVNTLSAGSIYIEEAGDGSFYLNDGNTSTPRYLYYHRNREKVNRWDAQGSQADACKFLLYRRAEESEQKDDSALPGYVQVASKEELKNGIQCLVVAAYEVDSEMQYYALYPSTEYGTEEETQRHLQSVRIVPEKELDGGFTSVVLDAETAGAVDLKIGNVTYHITVLAQPEEATVESTPLFSATGKSKGYPVTGIYMTSDLTFALTIGNNYYGEAVWSLEKGTVTDLQGNTVENPIWDSIGIADGVLSANTENHTYTYNGYVVLTLNEKTYKIPFRISPAISQTNKRSMDVYIADIYQSIVYCGWIYPEFQEESETPIYRYTALEEVKEGYAYYVNTAADGCIGFDFFAVAEEGYVLASMGATGSAGHYMRLNADKAENTEFCQQNSTATGGTPAGWNQQRFAKEAVFALVQNAIDGVERKDGTTLKFVGAQGFTREDAGGLATILTYCSEKVATVDKKIRGVWSSSRGYRDYVEGMAVTKGEMIIYNVDVQTYDQYDPENEVVYESAILKEELEGAYFIADPENLPDDSGVKEMDITADVMKDHGTANVHRYYAVYEVKEKDVEDQDKDIVNTVSLICEFSTKYQSSIGTSDAAANAGILLANNEWKSLVVDFGLSVKNVVDVTTKTEIYEISSASASYGTVTTEVTPLKNGNQELEGYQVEVTYTPHTVLQSADAVTVTDSLGNTSMFYVYPASSVYYEEGFASYMGAWTTTLNKGNGTQQTQVLTESEEKNLSDFPFGYDKVYADEATGSSNGTEAVSQTAGNSAQFNFTGTGVDIYANGTGGANPTGTVTVMVKDSNGKLEKLMIVNTCVAGSQTEGDATASQNTMTNAYNLPIVSLSGLAQGRHTVYIRHTRTAAEVKAETTYPVKLDGFRVYGTLEDQTVYGEFEEENPQYLEVRNAVLGAMNLTEVLPSTETEQETESEGETTADTSKSIYAEDIAKGLKQVYDAEEAGSGAYAEGKAYIITSGTSTVLDAKDLLDNGPKNEVYVWPGQSLVMKLNGGLKNVQIGLKAVDQAVTAMSVTKTVDNTTENIKLTDTEAGLQVSDEKSGENGTESLTTSTDMFYRIGDVDEQMTVTITNSAGGVLAVTDLKYFVVSGDGTENASVFTGLSEEDFIPALKTMGYASKAEETPNGGNEGTPEEKSVTRVYGADRYATAYATADALKEQLGIETYETVLVATGKEFADALSGSYLAVKEKAPILLTDGSEKVNEQLMAYLEKNAAKEAVVYILGGENAVSKEVMELLEKAGYAVERLGGASRYETNLNILNKAGIEKKEIIVSTGKDFADSLSVSATGKPVLLVKDALNAVQKELLRKISGGNIYIVGGEGAVSAAIEKELESFGTVKRIAGNTRYETSVEVSKYFFKDAKEAVLANAAKAYDGLCGGPLAASMDLPLILTKDGKADTASAYAQQKNITSGYVLGGNNALEDQTIKDVFGADQIKEYIYGSEK